MQKLAWTLVIIGSLALLGYAMYYSSYAFFRARDVPIAVKIAVPVVGLGVVMLLALVIKDRITEKSKEDFREVDK